MVLAKDISGRGARSGGGRFAAAIRYAVTVNDRTSEIAAVSERFAPAVDGVAMPDAAPRRASDRGERVEHVILSGIFSIETAAFELESIAALRPGVSDPVRHVVLSYDTARGERPILDEIDRDVKLLLRQRGFTDATDRGQRHHATAEARFEAGRKGDVSPFLAIVHGDTDSKHVHIIVCTVAPNGAVNPDFHPYGANEHAGAMIARAHGWEIVAGRKNGRLVAEQARARGATDAEIEALLRRDAPTLDRLRERDGDGTQRSGTRLGDAGRSDRRGVFIVEFGEAISDAFSRSTTFGAFKDALHDIGVIAKYSEGVHRRTGRVLPRLAFADAVDRAGDSGSRIGVTARAVIDKFGPIAIDARDPGVSASARTVMVSEGARNASPDPSHDRPARNPEQAVDPPAPGQRIAPSSLDTSNTASVPGGPVLPPDERDLATAVLARRSLPLPRSRSGGLGSILAGLGFASESMRGIRRRRQERQRRGMRAVLEADPTKHIESSRLEKLQERLAARRATILARNVRTPAGVEARDRALAEHDMRASYAVWKEAETKRQLSEIRAERVTAYEAHRRETRLQLKRAWEVERLFRDTLRSMGVVGVAARRAMSDAYETRRTAILASRKAAWAAVEAVRPEVKSYADWSKEQGDAATDRARVRGDGNVRTEAEKDGVAEPVRAAPEASKDYSAPLEPAPTAATETAGSASAPRRSDRFAAIFDRSDAEAIEEAAARRAVRDADLVEMARAEREAAIERSVVKAASKVLRAAGRSSIDEMRGIGHGPERTTAVLKLRDAILEAGRRRRAGRAAPISEARRIRAVQRGRDSPSR